MKNKRSQPLPTSPLQLHLEQRPTRLRLPAPLSRAEHSPRAVLSPIHPTIPNHSRYNCRTTKKNNYETFQIPVSHVNGARRYRDCRLRRSYLPLNHSTSAPFHNHTTFCPLARGRERSKYVYLYVCILHVHLIMCDVRVLTLSLVVSKTF